MKRGEIRWYTFKLPDKRRPVLILTRNEVVDHLNEPIVVPVTRTIRGLATEVVLLPEDGMPVASALNLDHIALAQRDRIGPVICSLPPRTRAPGATRGSACQGPNATLYLFARWAFTECASHVTVAKLAAQTIGATSGRKLATDATRRPMRRHGGTLR